LGTKGIFRVAGRSSWQEEPERPDRGPGKGIGKGAGP
jgi:hypothetical protein